MPGTPRPDLVSTKRQRIAELARDCPDMAFTNLAHHIDIEWLLTAHAQTRRDGAVGVDGQTADEYEVNLVANLQNLLDRAKSGTYVAPPVRRVHIPKAGSVTETRPLGIPTYEDKILQRAVLMVLEPVYETDFLDVSHGFRPGRGAHGALQSLWKQEMKLGGDWIVDVDLRKFFDTIDHGHLREFLKRRVRDGVILRLIGKWLNAGVLEEGGLNGPRRGYASRRSGHATNNVAKSSLIPDSIISRSRLRATYGHGWQPRLDPLSKAGRGPRSRRGGVNMTTSSRRRAIGIPVTRSFETNRFQKQSIASAYDALIPVISANPRRPHVPESFRQISCDSNRRFQTSAVGA